jgi:hypothetical protein
VNRIGGVIDSVIGSDVVDRWFQRWVVKIND